MIDGNAKEFISKLSYEDHYAVYNGKKYFFNGAKVRKISEKTSLSMT